MNNRDNTSSASEVHIPIQHIHAIRMSNRQYSLLRFLSSQTRQRVGIDELSALNQNTVGANKRRKWLKETSDRQGVELTHEGKEALKAFEAGDFMRSVARMKFSSFLSLDVYEEARDKGPAKEEKRAGKRKGNGLVKGLAKGSRSSPGSPRGPRSQQSRAA